MNDIPGRIAKPHVALGTNFKKKVTQKQIIVFFFDYIRFSGQSEATNINSNKMNSIQSPLWVCSETFFRRLPRGGEELSLNRPSGQSSASLTTFTELPTLTPH